MANVEKVTETVEVVPSDTTAFAALYGSLLVLLGIIVMFAPAQSFVVFVGLMGAYLIIGGIYSTIHSVAARQKSWGLELVWGILSLLLGIWILADIWAFAAVGAVTLLYVIGIALIILGIFQLIGIFTYKNWLLLFSGLLSLFLGIIAFTRPLFTSRVYAVIAGLLMVIAGFCIATMSGTLVEKKTTTVHADRRKPTTAHH